MSKEYVRLSIEEVMNIASNHMEEDAVHAQVVLDFAADIEKEVASRCRAQGGNTRDKVTQAAANKAAEEGGRGLPPLPEMNLIVTEKPGVRFESRGYTNKQMHDYARAAIADDRAARQVANKAEVEPVAHLKFWARQSWSGNGNHDVENAEGLEVCGAGEIGDDGEPAFPVYTTPPATTGASTVLTDERIERDFLNHWDSVSHEYGFHREFNTAYIAARAAWFAREIPAQAGQVVVPGWKLLPIEPTPAMSAAGFCVSEAEHDPSGVYRAMVAAAPSPAKESK